MDPFGIVAICFVGFLVLSKSSAPVSGTSVGASSGLASQSALAAALANIQKSISNLTSSAAGAAKPAAGSSGGSSGGGSGSPGGGSSGGSVASAGNSPASALQNNSTFTSYATINALANDGNPQDAQYAAYAALLDAGYTDVANMAIGNDIPIDLSNLPGYDQSSALNDINIAPVPDPAAYDPPAVAYDPGPDIPGAYTGDVPGDVVDSTDYGDYGYGSDGGGD